MNYQIRLYDDNLNLLHILDGATGGSIQKRPNNAGAASFSCRHDDELVSALELAANVKIYRGTQEKFAGQITGRDMSGTEYPMDVEGHEARLRALKTPKRWEGWNDKDLADVARDALLAFKFRRFTTQADWQLAYETYQVDTNTEPGSVTVEYEPHPDDPENERPKEFGYLILRLDLGAAALSAGRIVRWSEVVGDTERITIQSRSAATEAELSAAAWTVEETVTHVGEVELNEVCGISLAGDGRWLEIKVNLYAMDRETPHKDSQGNVTGYGFTPMLNGLEVIWREPSEIVAGAIPAATGAIVKDVTFDRTNHLQVLSQLCNDLGWEFQVRHDETTRQLVLDLGQEIGGVWQPTIGVDRSRNSAEPIVLRDGDNAIVTTLKGNITNMVGRLHCWGAGDGADQLYALVEDPELSDWPQEDDFTDSKVETIEDLIAAGQAELAKRNKPDVTFEVEAVGDEEWECSLGDTVTVVHPRTGMVLDCRILEEIVQWDEQGEKPKLGLNGFLYNAMDDFISNPSPDSLPSKPPTPKQVSAIGYYGYNIVSWRSPLDRFAVRYRKAGATDWLSVETKDKRFLHTQLTVGDRWEYQVAGIRGGKLSEWSEVVSAAVSAIDPGDVDIDYTPPATPAFDTCEFVTEVVLRWYPAERAKTYELRTDTNWGQQTGLVRVVSETEYRMRPAQRSYTFYLRARSEAGVYSDTWAEITLTNATPSTPPQPTVTEFFTALWIEIQPVADNDIQGYYLYLTPCDAQGTPTGPTEKTPLPGAQRVTYQASPGSSFLVEVSAFDALGEGNKSAPVQATTAYIGDIDIPDDILTESKLQADLRTKIDTAYGNANDYANQEIAYPTEEDATITSTSYTLTYSAGEVYVGTPIETDPNGFFDLTDQSDNELVNANGDPVRITDVQDELGNSLLGTDNPTWYQGDKVTLILSAAPANSACRVHYGVKKTLRELAKDALLKKGVTAKQVDANVIAALEDIKGRAWNENMPEGRNLTEVGDTVDSTVATLGKTPDDPTQFSSIKQNATEIANTVATLGKAPDDVTQFTSIKQNASSISSLSARVTTAEGEIDTHASQIQQNADAIEAVVAEVHSEAEHIDFDVYDPAEWITRTGTGTITVIDESTAKDGKALQIVGYAWRAKNEIIPFDPMAVYEIRFRIRQTADPTSGGKAFYAGVEGIAADGVTLVNVGGANSYASQFYVAASAGTRAADGTWGEYVGYIKGWGTYIGNANDPHNPSGLHPDVRFIRPMFIVNYAGGNGTVEIDYWSIRKTTAEQWTRIKQNADEIALKASQADLDAVEDRVTNAEAELIVQAGQIASKASQTEVDELTGRVTTTESEVTQMGNQYAVRVQTHANGKNIISGFGLLNDPASGSSEFGVMVDKFKIFAAPDDPNEPGTTIFALDTESGKLYLLADLILNGSITADKLSANALKTLMLQAQLATVDELDTLYLRADKLRVGSSGAPIPLAINPATDHLWHFDGTLQSTQGLRPEAGYVATLRQGEGKFGGAVAVEEGTENLIATQGGGAAQDWSKWNHWNSSAYWGLTEQYDDPIWGKVFKGTKDGASEASTYIYDYYPYSYAIGDILTFSCWMKVSKPITKSIVFYVNTDVGGQHNVATNDSKTIEFKPGEWQYVTWTSGPVTEDISGRGGFGLSMGSGWDGAIVEVAYPQLEKKPFATSFVDGTRAAGKLSFNSHILNQNQGAICGWFYENGQTGAWRYFWDTDGANRFLLAYDNSGNYALYINGSPQLTTPAASQGWHQYCVTWAGADIALYIDGDVKGTKTLGAPVSFSDVTTLYIGSRYTSIYQWNSLIDELLILPRAASAEEIAAWYSLQAPFYDPSPQVPEAQIPSASKWNQAVIDAQQALTDAADARAVADGKIQTFYQASAPTGASEGDLWIDTDDGNKLYRWDGASWIEVRDSGIQQALDTAAGAQATADGKVTTFYQTSTPTAEAIGDLWVDTDDHNRLYRWDGANWVDVHDTVPIDAAAQPISVEGLGGYLAIDQYGERWIRKSDSKVMYEFDVETGNATYAGTLAANVVDANALQIDSVTTDKLQAKAVAWEKMNNIQYSGSASGSVASLDTANIEITHTELNYFIGWPYVRVRIYRKGVWSSWTNYAVTGTLTNGGRISTGEITSSSFVIYVENTDETYNINYEIEWLRTGVA